MTTRFLALGVRKIEQIIRIVGRKKSSDSKIVPTGQAVAIWDEDIVGRVFPK